MSKNFDIKELVHPAYIEDHGEEKMVKVLQRYAQPTLTGLEKLREWLDAPIIINDYKYGGGFVHSGLRHYRHPYGSSLSAHYFMLAMDCKIRGREIKHVQEGILETQNMHPYITRMESYRATPSWLHVQFGCRLPNEKINIFMP